jgi:ligand-binding sensor domain-containing protein
MEIFGLARMVVGFTRFNADEGYSNHFIFQARSVLIQIPLPGTVVKTIFEDSQNRLWIGLFGAGLDLYDPKDQFIPAHHQLEA